MAKIFTNTSTTLAEANLNKLCAGDGTVGSHSTGYGVWGLRIRYTGAAWEAFADTGAENQIALATYTWHTTHLDIGLASTSNPFNAATLPVAVCSQTAGTTNAYFICAVATADDNIQVNFRDAAGTAVTTEDTSMDFQILIFGEL